MWIEKKPSGKLRLCEHYYDRAGKRRKAGVELKKETAQERKNAERALLARIQSLEVKAEDITLKQLIAFYVEEQSKLLKRSTWSRNEAVLARVSNILGASIKCADLKACQIRSALLASGKPVSTLNEYIKRLKALLAWGYTNEYHSNATIASRLFNFQEPPRRVKIQNKYLEHSELQRVVNAMTHTRWRLLTMFLALSGLRIGEAAALLNSDIDFSKRTISVTKTYDMINNEVTSAKTLCSIREVYMQDELYSICLKILAMSGSELFFPGKDGGHICAASYNAYLKKITGEMTGKYLTAHALRHTHASLLLAQGVSIDTIARRLGHENSRITKEIYLHVTEELKKRDNAQITSLSLFGGPAGDQNALNFKAFS